MSPAEFAEQVLLMLAHHVPADVEIGRPLAAAPAPTHMAAGAVQLTTTAGTWVVSQHEVDRILVLAGDVWELTTYQRGHEVSRNATTVR